MYVPTVILVASALRESCPAFWAPDTRLTGGSDLLGWAGQERIWAQTPVRESTYLYLASCFREPPQAAFLTLHWEDSEFASQSIRQGPGRLYGRDLRFPLSNSALIHWNIWLATLPLIPQTPQQSRAPELSRTLKNDCLGESLYTSDVEKEIKKVL